MEIVVWGTMVAFTWIALLAVWTKTMLLAKWCSDMNRQLDAIVVTLNEPQTKAAISKLSSYEYNCTREDLADYCP